MGVTAVAVLAGIMRASEPVLGGPDPFWHWDLGRRIVRNWLPTSDPYSFLTNGRDWVLNQWGTEALVGVVDAIGGLWLVGIFAALLVSAAYFHVGWRVWRRCPSLLSVALFGLVYMAGMSNLTLRGNLFTYLLAPVVLAELHREQGPRPLVVVLTMVVWTNLHAGYLMGLALLLVHAVGEVAANPDGRRRAELLRHRGFLLAAALGATMVTPYGPRLLWQSLALSLRGAGSGISEWGAPTLTAPTVLPFTLVAALALVSIGVAAGRRDLPDVLVIVAFTLLGASATRNLAPAAIILGITAAPYLYRTVQGLRRASDKAAPSPVRTPDRVGVATLATVGVAVIVVLVPATSNPEAHASNVPLAIVDELQAAERPIRAHVSSLWAPAVSILAGDDVRISVDGRLELFTADDIGSANTIENADPGWLDQLDQWCVTDVIVPEEGPAGVYLADHPDWTLATTDEVAGRDEEMAVSYRRLRLSHTCE